MVAVQAESMVGGTIHRKMIPREISRVLVLNLSAKASGAHAPPRQLRLDNAFALIEGHPLLEWRTQTIMKGGPPALKE